MCCWPRVELSPAKRGMERLCLALRIRSSDHVRCIGQWDLSGITKLARFHPDPLHSSALPCLACFSVLASNLHPNMSISTQRPMRTGAKTARPQEEEAPPALDVEALLQAERCVPKRLLASRLEDLTPA